MRIQSSVIFSHFLPLILILVKVVRSEDVSVIDPSTNKFSDTEKWIYGILTGIGLGLVGFFAAALVVYLKKHTQVHFDGFLKVLIAFAAGALLGDAAIHLIPEAFNSEEGVGQEGGTELVSPRLLSFFLCLGIFIFTILERVFLMIGVGHSHGNSDSKHRHDHSGIKKIKSQSDKGEEDENIPDLERLEKQKSSEENNTNNIINIPIKTGYDIVENRKTDENDVQNKQNHQFSDANFAPKDNVKHGNEDIKQDSQHNSDDSGKTQAHNKTESTIDLTAGWKNKKPEGFLNQLGDFLHNIMDGIALGVAFSSSDKSSVGTTIIAIFAHEIPQEMGNASILLNANFSGAQAMFCNGMVNFSCIIGIIIGIAVASLNEKSEKIMNCFIAGNFIYIGAAEMLPKLAEEKCHRIALMQICALALGFGVMFLILLAE